MQKRMNLDRLRSLAAIINTIRRDTNLMDGEKYIVEGDRLILRQYGKDNGKNIDIEDDVEHVLLVLRHKAAFYKVLYDEAKRVVGLFYGEDVQRQIPDIYNRVDDCVAQLEHIRELAKTGESPASANFGVTTLVRDDIDDMVYGLLEAGYTPDMVIATHKVSWYLQNLYAARLALDLLSGLTFNFIQFDIPVHLNILSVPRGECLAGELFLFDSAKPGEAYRYAYNIEP